ncbi:glycosyltransferase family 9 protein [Geothrix sp. 21YS21S-2]|uniref:glycosyltransferase family 9 protein n=1 Tax=Geothrix sp. 21YS21S-2 TaxID=3068893 RepID=UPI0027BAA08A|nr:glycosyltransferase family 9 protein [Geothrix sp. 21YS21S-2]
MRIVLLRLSALGDVLRVLPAWANLGKAFPGACFQAVIEDRHAFLLTPMPWLEPVVVRRGRLGSPLTALGELKRVAGELRGADVALDFHGILKSALPPWLAEIPERWGDGLAREGAGFLQTRPLPYLRQTRYAQALGLAGAYGDSRGVPGLGTFRPALADAVLPDPGPVWAADGRPRAVLVPGASRRGAIKRWPLRHWIALADRLKGRYQLRWSLGPEEEDLRAWLPAATGVEALPSLTLWQLAAALRQADRVVAPDTGLLHLAVVLGVRSVGVYGGSDPVVAGLPAGAGTVLRTGIECSPCRERQCRRRQCLEDLEPDLVAAELERACRNDGPLRSV